MKKGFIGTLAIAVLAIGNTQAGAILSPTSAVIDDGGPGFGAIEDTLNQNGLSSNFISGVTDFDTYLASNPTHTSTFSGFEWFSNEGTTGATVTYNLGSIYTIGRLALWNEEASGIGKLDLLYSTDNTNFFPLATGLTPFDNPSADYPAEVFSFASTDTQYVRFVITDSPQPNPGSFNAAAIGEVAFDAKAVPEPSAISLALVGGALLFRRRFNSKRS